MCDHCEVKPPPPPKHTVRAEYVAAKELVAKLEGELRTLSNKMFEELSKVEEEATEPFRKAMEQARIAAIDKHRAEHAAEVAKIDELRTQAGEARRRFASFKFECNHKDENGLSAVQQHWPLGSTIEDRPYMKCSVCAETWK